MGLKSTVATAARQKLVFITPCVPDPEGTGSEQRAYSFLLAYSKIMEVTLWFGTRQSGLRLKRLSKIAPICSEMYHFHATLLQNNTHGLHSKFVETLTSADHVHVFKLPFGIKHRSIVWDFDELPPDLRGATGPVVPIATSQGPRNSAGEIFSDFAKTCKLVIASSPLESHGSLGHVVAVDNCYHSQLVRRGPDPAKPGLLFVGSFSYGPNVDAATYLCSEIMPFLPADLRVALVGRKPFSDQHVAAFNTLGSDKRLELAFDVESVTPSYNQATVAIVPLRHGSGTRLKILEAFAHGCPVVTTSKGCEGLAVRDGVEVLVRDTAKDFAQACNDLLANASRRKALAKAGRAFLQSHNSQPVMEKQLYKALRDARILPAP